MKVTMMKRPRLHESVSSAAIVEAAAIRVCVSLAAGFDEALGWHWPSAHLVSMVDIDHSPCTELLKNMSTTMATSATGLGIGTGPIGGRCRAICSPSAGPTREDRPRATRN